MENICNTYVINLERRQDRWDYIKEHLTDHKIKFIQVIAVDGNVLQEPHNPHKMNTNYWNKYSLGLVKTFVGIIKHALTNNYKEIVVFEDDIILNEKFIELFNEYKKLLPNKWEIVQMSGGNHRKDRRFVNKHILQTQYTLGTYALLINSHCFEKILNICTKEVLPLDECLAKIQSHGNCYVFYPGIAIPKPNGYSDIRQAYENDNQGYNFHYYKDPDVERVLDSM